MFLGSKVQRVRRAENNAAICEQIVYTSGSQPVVRVPLEIRGGLVGGMRK
jgi:hypothetical protein